MKYKIESTYRGAKSRRLYERTTFNGEAESQGEALLQAQLKMLEEVEANPLIEEVSSTVTGENGSKSCVVDYAEDIENGTSARGLDREVQPLSKDEAPTQEEALEAIGIDYAEGKDGTVVQGDPVEDFFADMKGGGTSEKTDPSFHNSGSSANSGGAGGAGAGGQDSYPTAQKVTDAIRDMKLVKNKTVSGIKVNRRTWNKLLDEMDRCYGAGSAYNASARGGQFHFSGIPVYIQEDPAPDIQLEVKDWARDLAFISPYLYPGHYGG